MEASKEIKIALLGFGTVGSGVYELLKKYEDFFADAYDYKISIAKILEKRPEVIAAHPELCFTCNYDDILNDRDISIVVEMLGGIEPAASFMIEALKAGKHIVSSNKAALAARLSDIHWEAVSRGLQLKYEAAVAGAIPVMNVINNSLAADVITSVQGIVNGTSNYILSCMEEGLSYEEALKEAQDAGFAEADPSRDVKGLDSADKLVLLAVSAFGEYMGGRSFPVVGIEDITVSDIEEARKNGRVVRLVAEALMENGQLKLSVGPCMVPKDSVFGSCRGEFNAVRICSEMAGEICLTGKGAGKFPTASAVCADILDIIKIIDREDKE